jgi:hypothetical protein
MTLTATSPAPVRQHARVSAIVWELFGAVVAAAALVALQFFSRRDLASA